MGKSIPLCIQQYEVNDKKLDGKIYSKTMQQKVDNFSTS